ncbi:MAG: DUF3570 domain-containing protein [Deltaproteobacteria bacterium]|nr:DUF3570 domain-containing protein [Kofleriaceae bacterium]
MRPSSVIAVVTAVGAVAAAASPAAADDKIDFTTTWYQENRQGGLGGLTVVHPQLDLGVDVGENVTFDLGYAADAVTGATATVYAVDAVSSATTFDDLRHEGKLGIGFVGNMATLGLFGSLGHERDYLSIAVGGTGAVDLPGKNTNVALSYAHSFDEVCDKANGELTLLERRALDGDDPCKKKNGVFGDDSYIMDNPALGLATTWRDLTIDTVQGTLTQNLSPTMILQLSLYGQILEGFQSNPYRRVRIGPNEPQEHMPDTRARWALSARLNRFLPRLRSAVHVSARGYNDTWGVSSGTVELGYSQYMGDSLLLRVRARAYQQTAATFFKDAFFYETESTAGEYFTGDRELSPVRNALVGAKLTMISIAEDDKKVWGAFDKLQLNLKAEVLLLDEAAADDPEANTGGRDTQFLSSDQLLDAFTLQLGLLLDY